jgi:hypothetical protein
MLWPSLIMVLIAGTPSLVAGIFTNRLGWAMRLCNMRASRPVPAVSWARAGETSSET